MITINKSQISIMSIQYGYYPLKKSLDNAVRAGVEHMELWRIAPHFHLEDMMYADVCRVRGQIGERGLPLVCYAPEQCIYPVNLATGSTIQRRRSLKYFKDDLRTAVKLNMNKMLVTTGWGYLDNSNINEAQKHTREGFMPLGGMARDYSVKLALEVLRRDESNLVYNLPTLKGMMEDLSYPTIGVVIDAIPVTSAGEQSGDYLRVSGERLVRVRFIDGASRGYPAWGDGALGTKRYLEELSRYSYKDYLLLEITDGRYRVNPTSPILQSTEGLYDILN